uniref:Uncharacterized protein n=1 Tax=Glossina brevipalpis TaxID=37001 RepID=A0A1A9WUP3_9MUSC
MSMPMNFVKSFAVCFSILLTIKSSASQSLNTPEKERKAIKDFFNYVDITTDFKLNNMLKMTQSFVEQLLNSIPYDDRGNTAELLQQYIDKAENLRYHGVSIEEKENMLLELRELIALTRSGLEKQEKEDMILKQNMLGMFELLARLAIEERRQSEKFSKASSLLRRRFTSEGIQRHQQLFDLLYELEQEQDIVNREALFRNLKDLRAQIM